MATMTPDRPKVQEPETITVAERRRTGVVVVAIVIAALLGFGLGWAVFRDTGTGVPDDVQQVIDDYHDAWNVPDGEAAAALMAPAARFYADGYIGDDGLSRDELVFWVDRMMPDQIDELSTTLVGDGPYVVVVENNVGTAHGHSVFTVDESGGEMLIFEHIWLGD